MLKQRLLLEDQGVVSNNDNLSLLSCVCFVTLGYRGISSQGDLNETALVMAGMAALSIGTYIRTSTVYIYIYIYT